MSSIEFTTSARASTRAKPRHARTVLPPVHAQLGQQVRVFGALVTFSDNAERALPIRVHLARQLYRLRVVEVVGGWDNHKHDHVARGDIFSNKIRRVRVDVAQRVVADVRYAR